MWPRVPLLLNLQNKARLVLRRSRVECKFAKRAYARKYHLSRRFCEKLCVGNPDTDASISSYRTGISVATTWQMLMFACRIIQSPASPLSVATFRQSHWNTSLGFRNSAIFSSSRMGDACSWDWGCACPHKNPSLTREGRKVYVVQRPRVCILRRVYKSRPLIRQTNKLRGHYEES